MTNARTPVEEGSGFDQTTKKFINRLRLKGATWKQVAEELGVSVSSLTRIRKGAPMGKRLRKQAKDAQKRKKKKRLRVVELFAGIGGFRIGLEGNPGSTSDGDFKVVWSNQWEPSTLKSQHASDVYAERWSMELIGEEKDTIIVEKEKDGKITKKEVEVTYKTYSSSDSEKDIHLNKDIAKVDAKDLPNHDIMVGGFPCQDYSVAQGHRGKGIEGKKGVLWWEIHRLIEAKKPKHILLENVGRLTTSPANQRGRDMAVMLACLNELEYVVEWRIINAADYGFPQKRKRVFILAHRKGTKQYKTVAKKKFEIKKWIGKDSIVAKAFPIKQITDKDIAWEDLMKSSSDLVELSENFNKEGGESPFENSGLMVNNRYWTIKTEAKWDGPKETLADHLVTAGRVSDEFILKCKDITRKKGWIYVKGGKKAPRIDPDGFEYSYDEGGMYFPDRLNSPARTIVTGEGGVGASRNKHVVRFKPTKGQVKRLGLKRKTHEKIRNKLGLKKSEWLRRLVPVELEALSGFPLNHTAGQLDTKRAFFIGNALVVGIVSRFAEVMGKEL